jgi:hypothetical protein
MKKIRGERLIGITIHIYMEMSQGNSLYIYLYLKQAKMSCFLFYLFSFFFYKIGNRRAKLVLPKGEGWHQWEERGIGKRG